MTYKKNLLKPLKSPLRVLGPWAFPLNIRSNPFTWKRAVASGEAGVCVPVLSQRLLFNTQRPFRTSPPSHTGGGGNYLPTLSLTTPVSCLASGECQWSPSHAVADSFHLFELLEMGLRSIQCCRGAPGLPFKCELALPPARAAAVQFSPPAAIPTVPQGSARRGGKVPSTGCRQLIQSVSSGRSFAGAPGGLRNTGWRMAQVG